MLWQHTSEMRVEQRRIVVGQGRPHDHGYDGHFVWAVVQLMIPVEHAKQLIKTLTTHGLQQKKKEHGMDVSSTSDYSALKEGALLCYNDTTRSQIAKYRQRIACTVALKSSTNATHFVKNAYIELIWQILHRYLQKNTVTQSF